MEFIRYKKISPYLVQNAGEQRSFGTVPMNKLIPKKSPPTNAEKIDAIEECAKFCLEYKEKYDVPNLPDTDASNTFQDCNAFQLELDNNWENYVCKPLRVEEHDEINERINAKNQEIQLTRDDRIGRHYTNAFWVKK